MRARTEDGPVTRLVSTRALLRISGGYGLSVIIGGIISVAVLPVVIIVAGPATWATIAVAQGVAGFGVVGVGAGWAVTGPTDIARTAPGRRAQFYIDSVVSRGWLYVLAGIVCSIIAVVLTKGQPAIAVVTVLAGLLAGLSGGWFFVGEGSPMRFLLLETLPRNVGAIGGALMLWLTGDALWYVGLQLLGAVVATALSCMSILGRYRHWQVDLSLPRAIARVREHIPAVSMSATATLYVNLPIVVVQIFLPQFTAAYALAERIMRLALYATRPFVQVVQGYVPREDRTEQTRRARLVTRWTMVFGAVGGAIYTAAAPFVGSILSGGQLAISYGMALGLGIALAAMLVSQVTGFAVLTSFDMTRTLAWSTVAGAIVGVLLLIPTAILAGVAAMCIALGASEVAVLVYQLVALRKVLSPQRAGGEDEQWQAGT